MTNIFRTISTKFYQNRHGFVDDVTKTFGVFLGSQFLISKIKVISRVSLFQQYNFHKNTNFKFHKVL